MKLIKLQPYLQALTNLLNIDNYKCEENYKALILKEECYKNQKIVSGTKIKLKRKGILSKLPLHQQFTNLVCTLEFLEALFKIHLSGSHIHTLIKQVTDKYFYQNLSNVQKSLLDGFHRKHYKQLSLGRSPRQRLWEARRRETCTTNLVASRRNWQEHGLPTPIARRD